MYNLYTLPIRLIFNVSQEVSGRAQARPPRPVRTPMILML